MAGPAWFLPPSLMALPCSCLLHTEWTEMAASFKLLCLGKDRREGPLISASVSSSAVRLRGGWGLEPTQATQTEELRDGFIISMDMTARPHHRKERAVSLFVMTQTVSAFCAYSFYIFIHIYIVTHTNSSQASLAGFFSSSLVHLFTCGQAL